MQAPEQGIPVAWHNMELFPYHVGTNSFIPQLYIAVGTYWMLRQSYRPTFPVLAYHSTLVVNCRPGTNVLLHGVAIELVTMPLVHFLIAAEHGLIGFLCYDLRFGKR